MTPTKRPAARPASWSNPGTQHKSFGKKHTRTPGKMRVECTAESRQHRTGSSRPQAPMTKRAGNVERLGATRSREQHLAKGKSRPLLGPCELLDPTAWWSPPPTRRPTQRGVRQTRPPRRPLRRTPLQARRRQSDSESRAASAASGTRPVACQCSASECQRLGSPNLRWNAPRHLWWPWQE